MTKTVEAVYEDGVFRPLKRPEGLAEYRRVTLTVTADEAKSDRRCSVILLSINNLGVTLWNRISSFEDGPAMLRSITKLLSFFSKMGRQPRGQELMEICLFQMPGDPNNAAVLRKLKELPGVSITELMFRPDDTPRFSTPYVVIGSPRRDGPFPGVDGIRYFIEKVYPSYQRA